MEMRKQASTCKYMLHCNLLTCTLQPLVTLVLYSAANTTTLYACVMMSRTCRNVQLYV